MSEKSSLQIFIPKIPENKKRRSKRAIAFSSKTLSLLPNFHPPLFATPLDYQPAGFEAESLPLWRNCTLS